MSPSPGLVIKNNKLYFQFEMRGVPQRGNLNLEDTTENRQRAAELIEQMKNRMRGASAVSPLPPGVIVKDKKLYYQFVLDRVTYRGKFVECGEDTPNNRNTARSLIEQMKRDLRLGIPPEQRIIAYPFNLAVAEIKKDWLPTQYKSHPRSRTSIVSSLSSAEKFFKATPLHLIHKPIIERYKLFRLNEHKVQDVTLRKNLYGLSVFFNWAIDFGYLTANPIKTERVKIPSDKDSRKERIVKLEEESLYFKIARSEGKVDLVDAARLINDQGIRPDELVTLQIDNLDEKEHTLDIFIGKSRAAKRNLYLTSECFSILSRRARYSRKIGTPWLFPSKCRPVNHIGPLNKAHNKVVDAMGVKFFRLYDWRHTFATRASTWMDLPTLAYIMGHPNTNTLHRYIHPGAKRANEQMKKFDDEKFKAWKSHIAEEILRRVVTESSSSSLDTIQ